jgi:hypothetical protein
MLTDRFGYGNWTDIKRALRREQRCRLDHLFISRSEEDLNQPCLFQSGQKLIALGVISIIIRR